MIDLLDGKEIFERMDSLRKKKGLTFYMLAKNAGVPNTTLYNWSKRHTLPSLALLESVCYALDVSVIDFLAGDDEPIVLSDEQKEVIRLWNALSAEQKKSIVNLMKSM